MPDPVINHAARSRARGMRHATRTRHTSEQRARGRGSPLAFITPLLSLRPHPSASLPSQPTPRTGPRHATRLLAHTTRSTRDKRQLHRSRSFRSIEEGKEAAWVPRSRRSRLERLFGPSRCYIVEGRRGIGLGVGEKAEERAAMGRLFLMHLEGSVYSCKHCKTHLGLAGDIISKSFQCKHGKAYLFNKVVNVTNGVKEDRLMMTGVHTVSDIFCVGCGSIVGWKYEAAHEKTQRYKEGKFILERYKVSGPDGSSYWATHDAHLGGSDADDV